MYLLGNQQNAGLNLWNETGEMNTVGISSIQIKSRFCSCDWSLDDFFLGPKSYSLLGYMIKQWWGCYFFKFEHSSNNLCREKSKEIMMFVLFFPSPFLFWKSSISSNHSGTTFCNFSGHLFLYLTVRIGPLGNFSGLTRYWELAETLWIHTLCKLKLKNRKLRMAGRKRKYPNKENAVEGCHEK